MSDLPTPLNVLFNSAIGCKWRKLKPVFLTKKLFLFLFNSTFDNSYYRMKDRDECFICLYNTLLLRSKTWEIGFKHLQWCQVLFPVSVNTPKPVYFPTEAHILEDVNKCVQALQDRDPETVDRTAGQIRGRTARLEDVVSAEMENYQQGPYTDNVMRAVLVVRNESKFAICQDLKYQNSPSSDHLIS